MRCLCVLPAGCTHTTNMKSPGTQTRTRSSWVSCMWQCKIWWIYLTEWRKPQRPLRTRESCFCPRTNSWNSRWNVLNDFNLFTSLIYIFLDTKIFWRSPRYSHHQRAGDKHSILSVLERDGQFFVGRTKKPSRIFQHISQVKVWIHLKDSAVIVYSKTARWRTRRPRPTAQTRTGRRSPGAQSRCWIWNL